MLETGGWLSQLKRHASEVVVDPVRPAIGASKMASETSSPKTEGPDAAWISVISAHVPDVLAETKVADDDAKSPKSESTNVVTMFGGVCEMLELEREHQLALQDLKLQAERRSMAFEDERAAADQRYRRKEVELHAEIDRLRGATADADDLRRRNESIECDLVATRAAIDEHCRVRDAAVADLDAARRLLAAECQRSEDLDRRLADVRADDDLDEARRRIETLEQDLAEAVIDAAADVDEARQHTETLERDLADALAAADDRRGDVDRLRAEMETMRKDLDDERQQRARCERDLANHQKKTGSKGAAIQQLRLELDVARSQLDTERTRREAAETQSAAVDELRLELQALRATLDGERARRVAAETDLADERVRSNDRLASIDLRDSDVAEVRARLAEEKSLRETCERELKVVRGKVDGMDVDSQGLHLELQEERRRLEASEAELAAERDLRETLERELRAKTASFDEERLAWKDNERKLDVEVDQLREDWRKETEDLKSSLEIEQELRTKFETELEDLRRTQDERCRSDTGDDTLITVISPCRQLSVKCSIESHDRTREWCEMRCEDERSRFVSALEKQKKLRQEGEQHDVERVTDDVEYLKGELECQYDLRVSRRSYANAELARQTYQMRELRERQKASSANSVASSAKPKFEEPKRVRSMNGLGDCYLVGKTGLERRRMMYHLPDCAHLSSAKAAGNAYPMTIEEIKYMGHRPCPWCGPPNIGVLHNRLLL